MNNKEIWDKLNGVLITLSVRDNSGWGDVTTVHGVSIIAEKDLNSVKETIKKVRDQFS